MKKLGDISQEEMESRFPDLMEALSASPEDVSYCMNCDGLRTHTTEDCPYPEPPWMRSKDDA